MSTPTAHFGLTTYHSQIVLVGGIPLPKESGKEYSITNELWVSDDGTDWKQTIPPMSAPQRLPLAVNPGTPECIFVIGGDLILEVYIDGAWSSMKSIATPAYSYCLHSTFHNGNWLLVRVDMAPHRHRSHGMYCKVEELVSAARSAVKDESSMENLWKKCPIELHNVYTPVSFQDELLVIKKFQYAPGQIYALSPCTHSWVHVGDTPVCVEEERSAHLLIMGKSYATSESEPPSSTKVYKAVMHSKSS